MAIYDVAAAINAYKADPAGSLQEGLSAGNAIYEMRRRRQAQVEDEKIRNGLAQFYRLGQPAQTVTDVQGPDIGAMVGQGASMGQMGGQGMMRDAGKYLPRSDYLGSPETVMPQMQQREIPAVPGGMDYQGAADYLASQGRFEQAGQLAKLREGMTPQADAAFGSTLSRNGRTYQLTKTGKLIDLGEGFDAPTRVMDTGTELIVVPTRGAPTPVAVMPKGVDPSAVYSNNAQSQRQERGAQLDVQVAGDKKRIEAAAGREADVAEQVRDAGAALADLSTLEGALKGMPSPAALRVEAAKGFFGRADPKIQEAIGTAKFVSGRMLKYVERLPGAATDKDREVFMASAGVLSNDDLPADQRIAAARAAKEAYQRLLNKYGNQQQGSQPAGVKPTSNGQPSSIGKATLWLKSRNIKTQDDARKAVQELTRQGWTRPQIEQALDQAGL